MPELKEIVQLGVSGLAVFLFYRIIANHLHENTLVLKELRDVIRELKEVIQFHAKQ